jgi:hypothetical protein
VELIGEDMLFPTLPVAEEAYVAWALARPEGSTPTTPTTPTTPSTPPAE